MKRPSNTSALLGSSVGQLVGKCLRGSRLDRPTVQTVQIVVRCEKSQVSDRSSTNTPSVWPLIYSECIRSLVGVFDMLGGMFGGML